MATRISKLTKEQKLIVKELLENVIKLGKITLFICKHPEYSELWITMEVTKKVKRLKKPANKPKKKL